ncbi:hypothetical protein MettiDRAFT_0814 [Methanolobus tindarius DSM 2278]|uniref:Carboxypeptidase regulatory-like domain-containing protein n=1 Tax=Methanolobus tindarius DSM 2278 TaxID=1090322 RepID=W9DQ42_METTI|nr:carboxypeptidase-like regulatory domain-containing protein [Methanolobus tindarius]ETA67390.1 hypothetical protein MettiDRAFT_0814 [Methanolobus tindarius DSM 2278]
MRKLILMALCFCLLVLPASAGTELITNGDAETGDTSGWTVTDSVGYLVYSGPWGRYSGSYGFILDTPGDEMYQTIMVPTESQLTFYYKCANANDWLDIDGTTYSDFTNDEIWHFYSRTLSAGTHTIKYHSYSMSGNNYFCFDDVSVIAEEAPPIMWSQSSYLASDIANITYNYPSYSASSENFIDIRSYNPTSTVWELEERRMVYSDSGSIQYVVPAYESRQFRAELMTRVSVLYNPVEIGNATMQMTSEDASVVFDKYLYDRDENMTFGYYNMPSGSYVQFHSGPTADGATYFQQYSGLSGNGTAGYQLPSNGPYGELFYVRAYDSEGNQLSYDYAYTENEPTEKTTIHGRVRDSDTEAVIEGALVTVGSWTTLTDSFGDYSLTIDKGTWDIEISKTNYITKTVDDFTFSGTSYSYDPYLQPDPTASTTLHGTIANVVGGAISGAQITVSDGTSTKTAVSSSSGSWTISNMVEGETYTVKATATYYENHYGSLTFSSSSNTYAIVMVDGTSEGEEEEDDSGSSGGISNDEDDDSSSSSDDEYRPGRAAARGTLEQAEASIPGMFTVLMIIVFMAAIKKGSK